MQKGTLILICGLPGAGKTTLSKKLAVERKAHRFCPDDWVMGVLKDPTDMVELHRLRDPVEQLLWKEAQKLLKLGVTVILENGFWSRSERSGYLKIAKKLGAKVELHFLDTPFNVLWQRVNKRNSQTNEFFVSKETLKKNFQVFQPPTGEEGSAYDLYKRIQVQS
jgi:predicted kinase